MGKQDANLSSYADISSWEIPQELISAVIYYENSISREDGARAISISTSGQLSTRLDCLQLRNYASMCQKYIAVGEELDEATAGASNRYEYVSLGETPRILLDCGFSQKPMLYTQQHLRWALHEKGTNPHWHGLSIEQLKSIPESMTDPVVICDNPSRPDTVLVVLSMVDPDLLPVVLSVKHDGKGYYQANNIDTNMVLSIFGKTAFQGYFDDKIIEGGRLIYIDEKKSQELERLAKRQLFGNYSNLGFNRILKVPDCLVNSLPYTTLYEKLQSYARGQLSGRGSGLCPFGTFEACALRIEKAASKDKENGYQTLSQLGSLRKQWKSAKASTDEVVADPLRKKSDTV